jgi:stage III sporulation protein AD
MIKIACIGLMAVFLAMTLKNIQSEYAMIIGIAACMILFGLSLTKLEVIMESIENLRQYVTINSMYIGIVLKVVGIAYISEFSANLCKDAGYSGIASQIEMFGKLSILVMSMPILTTLLTTIQEFVDRV